MDVLLFYLHGQTIVVILFSPQLFFEVLDFSCQFGILLLKLVPDLFGLLNLGEGLPLSRVVDLRACLKCLEHGLLVAPHLVFTMLELPFLHFKQLNLLLENGSLLLEILFFLPHFLLEVMKLHHLLRRALTNLRYLH